MTQITTHPLFSYLKRIYRVLKGILQIAFIGMLAGYMALLFFHLQPFTIITGSMQKTIPVGSLVVDKSVPPQTLKVGDVISFQKPIGSKGLDTHRIVEVRKSNGHTIYRTKGDSNPVADPWVISFDSSPVAHKMLFHIPFVGYLLLFARSKIGLILLIGYICFTVLAVFIKMLAQATLIKEEKKLAAANGVITPKQEKSKTKPVSLQEKKAKPALVRKQRRISLGALISIEGLAILVAVLAIAISLTAILVATHASSHSVGFALVSRLF
jgi:signal peptidase